VSASNLELVASVAARTPSAIFLSAAVGRFGAGMAPNSPINRRKGGRSESAPPLLRNYVQKNFFGWWMCGSDTRCKVLARVSLRFRHGYKDFSSPEGITRATRGTEF
jgi:hypothetical protein